MYLTDSGWLSAAREVINEEFNSIKKIGDRDNYETLLFNILLGIVGHRLKHVGDNIRLMTFF